MQREADSKNQKKINMKEPITQPSTKRIG